MKKMLLVLAVAFAAMQAVAANVDLASAQSMAQQFLMSHTASQRFNAAAPAVKWVHQEMNSSNANQAAYYVINTDRGFVVVAGDDRAQEILAYGDRALDNMENLPENMRFWLGYYKMQMELLQSRPGRVVEKKTALRATAVVEPLLAATWDQGFPYYSQCPMDGDRRALTGCATTSLAQVFYKWKHPTEPTPVVPGYTTSTRHLELPELPSVTFDWDNMMDAYTLGHYEDVNKNAVAQLMRYIGQAERMDYCNDGSTAWEDDIVRACEMYGYEDAHVVYKSDVNFNTGVETELVSDADWSEMLKAELNAGRPIVFCAYDYSSAYNMYSGHAFNVDGYDVDGLFHINWGWSGTGNGYFALNAFANQGNNYHIGQLMIANIEPTSPTVPALKVSPAALDMECYAGETATATFTVKGRALSDDLTMRLNDANGVFSLDPATITAADVMQGVTVTVTFAPQVAGVTQGSVTLSCPGVEDVTVSLKGTAKSAPLVVYDPVMLPADAAKVTLTSFTANWTDETAPANVASYTLDVSTKPNIMLIDEADCSGAPDSFSDQSSNAAALFPAGWTFNGTSGLWAEGGCISLTGTVGFSTSTYDLSGFDKVSVVINAKGSYQQAKISVATSVDSKEVVLTSRDYTQYIVVLNCAQSDQITLTNVNASGNPAFKSMQVYAGEMSEPALRASETGDATCRVITGITDKAYTVGGLTAGGTFLYKVKAHYTDGTESAWSNVEEVILTGAAPVQTGDVNGDTNVNISDVTALINLLLKNAVDGNAAADVNGDQNVNISDVTALINLLLKGAN